MTTIPRARFDGDKVRSPYAMDLRFSGPTPLVGVTGEAVATIATSPATVQAGNRLLHAVQAARVARAFTGESVGVLTELSVPNEFLHSNDFGNAYWTKAGGTISTDARMAPDGTQTADVLVEEAASSSRSITRSFGVTSGQPYTVSFDLEALSHPQALIFVAGTGFSFGRYFDLVQGTILGIEANAPLHSQIERTATGWQCSITYVPTSSSATVNQIYSANAAGQITFTGVGATQALALWGAQFVAAPTPTSRIETVGSVVTRNVRYHSAPFPLSPAQIAAAGGCTVVHEGVQRDGGRFVNSRRWQVGEVSGAGRSMGVVSTALTHPALYVFNGSLDTTVATTTTAAMGQRYTHAAKVAHRKNAGLDQFRTRLVQFIDGVESGSSPWSAWFDATPMVANGWTASQTIWIGAREGGASAGATAHRRLAVVAGPPSDDTLLPPGF